MLLAFLDDGPDGFVGSISDPLPVHWSGDTLVSDPVDLLRNR